jgi:protein-disulfide isomerase
MIRKSGFKLRAAGVIPALLLLLAAPACGKGDVRAEAGAPAAAAVAGPGAPAAAEEEVGDTIDLRRIGYAVGEADAPVTVFEFSDFGCRFCAMFSAGSFPELQRDYVATGKVRWVFVPFVMGMFPNSAEAARAGECAGEQEKFWQMKSRVYANQNEWNASRNAAKVFAGYAKEIGLDEARFASCYRENRAGARTRVNNRAADALRVRATPSFFINGRLVEGALPIEQFRMLLDHLTAAE